MGFRELKQRYEATHADQDRIRRAIDRRWTIDSKYSVAGYGGGGLEVMFYMSSWGSDDSPPRVGFNCGGSGESADRLSARALRRIAAVKQLYEDWFEGKISEIPADLPAEIANLP